MVAYVVPVCLQTGCADLQLCHLLCHTDLEGSEDYDSFKTFGKSRVTDVGRDGSITYTFEEDDEDDAQSLTSQLLGRS